MLRDDWYFFLGIAAGVFGGALIVIGVVSAFG